MEKIKIVGIIGSLRKQSYNRMLMNAAIKLKPDNCEIEIADISEIPPYNQDIENSAPESVVVLQKKIKEADAVLISTPEYNYSVPGVLKNAIDWASRPYGSDAFTSKAIGIMSASIGQIGGARAQYHLRQSFVYLDAFTVNKPEVMLSFANEKFDDKGELKDEKTKELIRLLLTNIISLARLMEKNEKTVEAL
jgi:chromate reductase